MLNFFKSIIPDYTNSKDIDTSKKIVNGICTTCKTTVSFKDNENYVCNCNKKEDIKRDRLFSDKQRTEIFLRDAQKCTICGTKVTIGNFEADHIKPFSKGGLTTLENGQCTCRKCNRSKGAKY